MKHNRIILVTMIAGVLLLAWFLLWGNHRQKEETKAASEAVPTTVASSNPSGSKAVQLSQLQIAEAIHKDKEARERKVKIVQAIFGAPIAFYGKVIDQHGDPVAEAQVKYEASDKLWGDASQYSGMANANGYFSITGIKGAGIYVKVSKKGYDLIERKSYQSFNYGMPPDEVFNAPPTKDAPAIFVLRKKVDAETLLVIDFRQCKIPLGGISFEIDLRTGKSTALGKGDLVIERWEDTQNKDTRGRFDWKFRLSVPGGGLVERNTEMDFQSPETGYQEVVEVSIPKSLEEAWRRTKKVSYFLKLKDGTFARVNLEAYATYTNFLVLNSYLNPQPGSQNLEYDPEKQINPR